MVTRALTPESYEKLCDKLFHNNERDLSKASYTISLRVDDTYYSLDVHLETANRVTVLQAVKSRYEKESSNFERNLVTKKGMLTALLEVFLHQYVYG